MPRAETYERLLLATLASANVASDVTWLRLSTPLYASSDRARIARVYVPLAAAIEERTLDGLIITGAPVEALPFEAVTYWHELSALLQRARETIPCTLGLCWGGLALARLLEIDKVVFAAKLFGVYPLQVVDSQHPLLHALAPAFDCPQSRHSGLSTSDVSSASAQGRVRLLAHSLDAGPVILESSDRRFLVHTGHPEYDAERLGCEYRRDLAAQVLRVNAPHNFDVERPDATWRSASAHFFRSWLQSLRR
jgi:homoserine O-succinyltransferase/O-acetyltransferase